MTRLRNLTALMLCLVLVGCTTTAPTAAPPQYDSWVLAELITQNEVLKSDCRRLTAKVAALQHNQAKLVEMHRRPHEDNCPTSHP